MVRYKGQKVDIKDIEVVYTDHWGEEFTGDIEDYGRNEWHEAWAECEAGEGLTKRVYSYSDFK